MNLITASVDRTSVSAWLYKYQLFACQRNKPNTSMTHLAYKSNLLSVARRGTCWSHTCPENWVAIGRAGVYFTFYTCTVYHRSRNSQCRLKWKRQKLYVPKWTINLTLHGQHWSKGEVQMSDMGRMMNTAVNCTHTLTNIAMRTQWRDPKMTLNAHIGRQRSIMLYVDKC